METNNPSKRKRVEIIEFNPRVDPEDDPEASNIEREMVAAFEKHLEDESRARKRRLGGDGVAIHGNPSDMIAADVMTNLETSFEGPVDLSRDIYRNDGDADMDDMVGVTTSFSRDIGAGGEEKEIAEMSLEFGDDREVHDSGGNEGHDEDEEDEDERFARRHGLDMITSKVRTNLETSIEHESELLEFVADPDFVGEIPWCGEGPSLGSPKEYWGYSDEFSSDTDEEGGEGTKGEVVEKDVDMDMDGLVRGIRNRLDISGRARLAVSERDDGRVWDGDDRGEEADDEFEEGEISDDSIISRNADSDDYKKDKADDISGAEAESDLEPDEEWDTYMPEMYTERPGPPPGIIKGKAYYRRTCGWNCNGISVPVYMCRGCERVAYCNEECQENDWDWHHHRCMRPKSGEVL